MECGSLSKTVQILSSKEALAYKVFDKSIKSGSKIVIAYSGGKDSTALAILLYRWMNTRKVKGLDITLLHNDTLSEINPMEEWAKKFMADFVDKATKLGNKVAIRIVTPPAVDTFYWRVIVRGYPAMSFNFRWCVKLLKIKPTSNNISSLSDDSLMFTGLRETESVARGRAMQKKYGGCAMGASKCLAYYFLVQDDNKRTRSAPMRDWSTADVWEFMRNAKEFDINDLLYLYGCDEARYGCWHCTLAKVQWGLHTLNRQYLYLDALRILYRKISDLPEMRLKKKTGYSRLGPLNAAARSLFLHLMEIAETKSGIALYGMNEAQAKGHTLREIFYNLNANSAMKVILDTDVELNPKRRVHISELRNLQMHKKLLLKAIPKIQKSYQNDKSYLLAVNAGFNPADELLAELQSRL